MGQLAEYHAPELSPAGESFGVALGLMLVNQRSKFRYGKMLQKLIDQAGRPEHSNALVEAGDVPAMSARFTHYVDRRARLTATRQRDGSGRRRGCCGTLT